jgi:pSer/pThr/pTyr-binding forkhead associated (FHA) protein
VTDSLLDIFKFALLALLYLFFARVLWAVWSEVRTPKPVDARPTEAAASGPADPTVSAARPSPPVAAPAAKQARPRSGRRGEIARLTIIQPKARKGSAYALDQEISIGRAETCTVGIVDDTFVSQLHARVFRRDGSAWVEDLASTNGTFLNGQRLLTLAEPLTKGDRIQVGSTILEAD